MTSISKDDELVDQSHRLSPARFFAVFLLIQMLLLIAFLDQFGVSTILPYVGEALSAADTISWAGTSAIVTTIGSQMIVARVSDIFGRRNTLLAIVFIFVLGNLMCGFARNAIWLYACRGMSGIGAGGIISLSMTCVADLVPTRQRGKYQGYTGFTVALGSATGPLIGAAMATNASWRWTFWITVPLLTVSAPALYFLLPRFDRHPLLSRSAQIRQIDLTGSLLLFAASILLLVPISGGGTIFPWTSPTCVCLLMAGVLALLSFLAVQRWVAKVPILPARLFGARDVNLILFATTTQGWIYYGTMFFIPLYLQEVRGASAARAAVLLLPMIIAQGVALGLAGQLSALTAYIVPQIQVGYVLSLIGVGLMVGFDRTTDISYIVGVLFLTGFGAGLTLQTTLVAMQNTSPEDLRAVITGARNTFRSVGGSIGLAVAGNLRSSMTRARLEQDGFSSADVDAIISRGPMAIVSKVDYATGVRIERAVVIGTRAVWYTFIPLIGLSLVASAFIHQIRLPPNESDSAMTSLPRVLCKEHHGPGVAESGAISVPTLSAIRNHEPGTLGPEDTVSAEEAHREDLASVKQTLRI